MTSDAAPYIEPRDRRALEFPPWTRREAFAPRAVALPSQPTIRPVTEFRFRSALEPARRIQRFLCGATLCVVACSHGLTTAPEGPGNLGKFEKVWQDFDGVGPGARIDHRCNDW